MSDARHALMGGDLPRAFGGRRRWRRQLAGQGVFDGVPQGAAHPFVSIGEVRSGALDADDVPTVEHRVELIVNSPAADGAKYPTIADRIRDDPRGRRVGAGRAPARVVAPSGHGRERRAGTGGPFGRGCGFAR